MLAKCRNPHTCTVVRIDHSHFFPLSLVVLPTANITFLQMEPIVLDNVVTAANLSCTVANEGSFQWQWTPPPGIPFPPMWVADGTRTSIVQISQISAANARNYTCRASFNGQSATTSIALQLNCKYSVAAPSSIASFLLA